MTTRRRLLLLLRTRPGSTVAELAEALGLTTMAVRRHLEALEADDLAAHTTAAATGPGRPPARWRLSPAGLELFPRRYDGIALDVLEDIADQSGHDAVDHVFARRTEKVVTEYEAALASATSFEERVAALAELRDEAGYLAEWEESEDGTAVITENNCAVHRVAERYPVVCAMELALLQRVMGADVEVSRVAHTMSGDAVCSYRFVQRRYAGGT